MKASRLLHLLLVLQTRQRITTAELAERLEVSRRTVLRDVEALSAAGVPVYAERGRHGGIVLLPGARLNVSSLEPPELEVLSVPGLDAGQRDALGLTAAHESAVRKMAARQAAAPGPLGLPLSEVVLVDGTAWFAESTAQADPAELASALRERRRMRIDYRHSAEERPSPTVVDPYGVVARAGRWYLVADEQGVGRLFALDRLSEFTTLEESVVLRPEQTLRTVWTALRERTEAPGHLSVLARLRATRVDLARRILGARLHEVGEADDGWCTIVVRYHDLEAVRQLLQFGEHIEVLGPAAARERVHQLAVDLAARHADLIR